MVSNLVDFGLGFHGQLLLVHLPLRGHLLLFHLGLDLLGVRLGRLRLLGGIAQLVQRLLDRAAQLQLPGKRASRSALRLPG